MARLAAAGTDLHPSERGEVTDESPAMEIDPEASWTQGPFATEIHEALNDVSNFMGEIWGMADIQTNEDLNSYCHTMINHLTGVLSKTSTMPGERKD